MSGVQRELLGRFAGSAAWCGPSLLLSRDPPSVPEPIGTDSEGQALRVVGLLLARAAHPWSSQ